MGKALNTEEFIKRSNLKHNSFYDYSKTVYTSALQNVTIICPLHGEFEQRAASHMRGNTCKECGRNKANKSSSMTKKEFITTAHNIHHNKYNYSKVKYKNSKTKVLIICPAHGEFSQQAGSHLSGTGCPDCAFRLNAEKTKYSLEKFVKLANLTHANKYDYSESVYVNSQTKLTIKCPVHGTFKQKPNSHIAGRGCSKCAEIIKRKRYHNEPTLLYLLYFPFLQMYKLGITLQRRGVEKRYEIETQSYIVCDTILYNEGKEAYEEEQRLLEKHNAVRYTGPKLLRNGNTELFFINILKKEKETL